MLSLTRCKCEGFDEEIPLKDNADDQMWLAEFALGHINDAIQKQHMSGKMCSVICSLLILLLIGSESKVLLLKQKPNEVLIKL